MGLESATYIDGLTPSWPLSSDNKSVGDDHLRLIKSVLQFTFPSTGRAWRFPRFVTKTANYSVLATDDETIILVDTAAGNVTITLPAVPTTAFKVTVMKASADANQVLISGTVSGGTLANLKSNGELYRIGGNGAAYYDLTSVPRNASITYAKIQNVGAKKLTGNSGAGAAVMEEIGVSSDFLLSSSTLALAAGTLGSFLGKEGLNLSTAGSSATMTVSAGAICDVVLGGMMVLGASLAKTTSIWTVGAGGGLDTGTIAATTWYHWFLIKRLDTGVVDVLFSLSPTAPAMPANYTLKRRFASAKTDGASQWKKLYNTQDMFSWDTVVAGTTLTYATGSRSSVTIDVPTGIQTLARFKAAASNLGVTGGVGVVFSALQETDNGSAAGFDLLLNSSGYVAGQYDRLTNTSAQVGLRPSSTDVSIALTAIGWRDLLSIN